MERWPTRSDTTLRTSHGHQRLLQPEPGPDRGRQGWRGQDHHGGRPGPPGRPGRASPSWWWSSRAARGWPPPSAAPSALGYAGSVLNAAGAGSGRRAGGRRHGASRRARSRPGPSPPTTPCSSTWPTTGCAGSPSGCCRRGSSTWWPAPSPASGTSWSSGKVKQLERSGVADLVLVDAPATGHTMTFLSSAGGLLDAARGGPDPGPGRRRGGAADRSGPVPGGPGHPARGDAGQRGGRGRLPARGQGRLALGPVIVNACYPPLDGLDDPAAEAAAAAGVDAGCRPGSAGPGRGPPVPAHPPASSRREQLERLAEELPLPQLRVPFVFTDAIGPDELDALSQALAAGHRGACTNPRPGHRRCRS